LVLLIDRRSPAEMTSYGNAGGIQNLATTPIGMPGMLRGLPQWLMDPLGRLHIQPRYLPRALPWLLRFAWETTERRVRHNANQWRSTPSDHRHAKSQQPMHRQKR
jgi:D-amino-acid dehydrogenase